MIEARERWNRFWFAPAPPTTLACLRAGVAALAFVSAVVLWPDVDAFYSATALGTAAAKCLDAALLVAAAALFAGARTRLSAIVVLACLVGLAAGNPVIFNSGDTLLRHLAVIVALAPAGTAWSVDRRWWSDDRGSSVVPMWPLRLVQLQIAVMYAAGVMHKLAGTTWWDGTAASYPLRLGAATRYGILAGLADSPTFSAAFTWGTLAIEAAIPVFVWHRRTRPWVLALGATLHLAIDVMLRAGLFSWVVLVSYVAFLPPNVVEAVVRRWRSDGPGAGDASWNVSDTARA